MGKGVGRPRGGERCQFFMTSGHGTGGFPSGTVVKNPPAMQETWVPSRGREDPLEKENGSPVTYSCLENSMDGKAGGLESMGSQRVGHD